MRVTGVLGLLGLIAMGLIVGDIWAHPQGTTAAGTQIVSLEKNTGNQLLGQAAK